MPQPKKSKPRLTAHIVDCLEAVCAYASIGMELSSMETDSAPEDEAKMEAGIQYLRKLRAWYETQHRSKTGHWRWCTGPSDHTGPCPEPKEAPREEPKPEVDPEFEAAVQEILRQEQERAARAQRRR